VAIDVTVSSTAAICDQESPSRATITAASAVAPTARSASPEAAFTPCATDSVDARISVIAAVTACSSELTTVALRAVLVKAP